MGLDAETATADMENSSGKTSEAMSNHWRVFFRAEDGIRGGTVTGVQTCALPICRMPSLIHQIASRDNPATPGEAKGGPLSERIARGKPCSLKAASKIGRTCSSSGRATA